MPRKGLYPNFKKKFWRGKWEIYWNWNFRRYTFAPGYHQEADEPLAESELRQLAAALSVPIPSISEKWRQIPGVMRYLRDRYGEEKVEEPSAESLAPQFWLKDYEPDIYDHCAERWAKSSLKVLERLDAFVPGGIGKTTPIHANRFLEAHKAKGNSPGTRNRNLAVCNRFFKWCLDTGRITENPFGKIKKVAEEEPEEIVYCSLPELERVVKAARATGRPDWHAVAIALHAGLRREEVFRVKWPDIVRDGTYIHIKKSKTRKKRLVPIVKALREILKEVRGKATTGYVVPRAEGGTWANQADRLVELSREALCRPENPNLAGRASEAIGKRRFLMTDEEIAGQPKRTAAEVKSFGELEKTEKQYLRRAVALAGLLGCQEKAHDGEGWIPAERLGWNAWRHTFASLRAQGGKGLDLISEWMGNSYAVCRRNYAQLIPRDGRAEDAEL